MAASIYSCVLRAEGHSCSRFLPRDVISFARSYIPRAPIRPHSTWCRRAFQSPLRSVKNVSVHLRQCFRTGNGHHQVADANVHGYGKPDENFIKNLRSIVGEKYVSTSDAVRSQHGRDEGPYPAMAPELVVWPQSTEHVSEIAKACSKANVPMIPFGTGTGLEGGVSALMGGVCVDLTSMNGISDLHVDDFDVTLEPGVTRTMLNHHLKDYGLWFPIDPGADASLCGMCATSASGTNAVRYGTMRENVLNLEVVLADGTIFHTAGKGRRTKKTAAGYNLTNLFVGSEGTLGFITGATLRIHAMPESMVSAVCSFPSVKEAINTAVGVMQSAVPIARIEFLDEIALDACNKYSQTDYQVAPTLFLEFHGSPIEVEAQTELVSDLARENGGSEFRWAKEAEDRNHLWQARHDLLYAVWALCPGSRAVLTDVCVPVSHLTEMVLMAKEEIQKAGLIGVILGHIGDGNVHPTLLPDPEDPRQEAKAKELGILFARGDVIVRHTVLFPNLGPILGHVGDGNFHAIILFDPKSPGSEDLNRVKNVAALMNRKALSLQGTCTGEHGIGIGKIPFLREEIGDRGVDVMWAIKNALDPKGLMNPGKVLPPPQML